MSSNAVDDAPLSEVHKKLALYSSGDPFLGRVHPEHHRRPDDMTQLTPQP